MYWRMGETIIPHDQRVQEVLRSAYHWLDRRRPKLNRMSTIGRAKDLLLMKAGEIQPQERLAGCPTASSKAAAVR
jgi:hypothetical protein